VIAFGQVHNHAQRDPGGCAVVDAGQRFSWSDWADVIARTTTGLSRLLALDDPGHSRARGAFLSGNRWEVAALQGAAATLGLPLVGIDTSHDAATVAECLRQLGPSVVAVAPSCARLLAGALDELLTAPAALAPTVIVMGTSEDAAPLGPGPRRSGRGTRSRRSGLWHGRHSFALGLRRRGPGLGTRSAGGSAIVSWDRLVDVPPEPSTWPKLPYEGLGFTSGTTGAPKLVVRSASFEARRAQYITERFAIGPEDVYLNVVPLSHASGPGWARVFASAGAPVVLLEQPEAPLLARTVQQERVTATLLVPPVLAALTSHLEGAPLGTHDVRLIVTGGRHVTPRLVRECRQHFGEVLHVYYGTTETGLNTLAGPQELVGHPGTAGTALPGNAVQAVGPDGAPVPTGAPGRLAVSGYMVADGYVGHPAPVVELEGSRWWLTSDTGRLDAAGRVFVAGRDLPPTANVDVNELEGWLTDRLGLDDVAAVVDVTDHGPSLTIGFVSPAGRAAPSEVEQAAREWVANSAPTVPALVRAVPVPHVPYSPTGKVGLGDFRSLVGRDHVPTAAPQPCVAATALS
jgi:acyl-CoA synthetase (AMP-forming)/AMP-acid ligase II